LADLAALSGMAANRDEEFLALACFFGGGTRFEPRVIAERAAEENIVPGGDVERGDADIGVVLFYGPTFPVIIVGGMHQPIEEIGGDDGGGSVRDRSRIEIENWVRGEGKCVDFPGRTENVLKLMGEGVRGEPGGPRFVEPLLEGTALVCPAIVIIAGSDHRADACEVRRMSDGGEHLRSADVRPAKHADLAVRIRLSGNPLDGVVAVLGFVEEGVPVTVGSIPAANVLNEDDVAVGGSALREVDVVAPDSPAIGSALKEDREFTVGIRAIDVATENDAISHFDFDIALDSD
jgi:hypothetical protein